MKRYYLYTIKMKFMNVSTVLKRRHLASCTEGKEAKQEKAIRKTYKHLYDSPVSQLVGIDMEEITEEKYKELKRELEEEI
ncbi:TPA: hypothetical protein QCX65_001497 [Bacillus mycoides]|nr:hypothetical protein [Bacillus mycoides]